jgi:zinc transport system substrate-binding protein
MELLESSGHDDHSEEGHEDEHNDEHEDEHEDEEYNDVHDKDPHVWLGKENIITIA